MIYLQLFYTFFKIGLFGFGGGYAMLSMIQGEVVTRYGWVTSQEFTDIVLCHPRPQHTSCRRKTDRKCVGIDCCHIRCCFPLFHTDADNQQILSEISETSGSGIYFCRIASGSCRIISFRRTGIDECGKLRLTYRRHLHICHQHHYLPDSLYRHQKIQGKSDINDYRLRDCRTTALLK